MKENRRRQAGEEYTSSKAKQIQKKLLKLKIVKGTVAKIVRRVFAKRRWKVSIEIFGHFAIAVNSDTMLKSQKNIITGVRKKTANVNSLSLTSSIKILLRFQFVKISILGVLNISDNLIRKYYEKVEKADGNQFRDMSGK